MGKEGGEGRDRVGSGMGRWVGWGSDSGGGGRVMVAMRRDNHGSGYGEEGWGAGIKVVRDTAHFLLLQEKVHPSTHDRAVGPFRGQEEDRSD